MKKVFKYPLRVEHVPGFMGRWEREQAIKMPCGAQILSVGLQDNQPMIWALVNPEAPPDRRVFHLVGTGHELPDEFGSRKFVGTVIFQGGGFVLHVFE